MRRRRARSAIIEFVRNSGPRLDVNSETLSELENRTKRHEPILVIEPSVEQTSRYRHIDELQDNFERIAGQRIDLDDCPDAWLLLSAWDESWADLTNPKLFLDASRIISFHAEMRQIINLMCSYRAITLDAADRLADALGAVLESRIFQIYREHGDEGLTIHISSNFSQAYSSEGISNLH